MHPHLSLPFFLHPFCSCKLQQQAHHHQAPLAGHHNYSPSPFFHHQFLHLLLLHLLHHFQTTNSIFFNLFHQETPKEPITSTKLHHHLHHHLHHRSLHRAYHLHPLVNLFPVDYSFIPRNNVCKIPIWRGELDLHLHLLQTTTTLSITL